MNLTGRLGHSCAWAAVGTVATTARSATTTSNLIIEKLLPFVFAIDYRIGPSPARLAAAFHSRPLNAVFDLSPRAHGLDQAHAARAFCRGLACRADARLHRGHVRHRRYRDGEGVVADNFRYEQAAIRQARGSELHHRRGEQ